MILCDSAFDLEPGVALLGTGRLSSRLSVCVIVLYVEPFMVMEEIEADNSHKIEGGSAFPGTAAIPAGNSVSERGIENPSGPPSPTPGDHMLLTTRSTTFLEDSMFTLAHADRATTLLS